jgi:LacI family transcriptional regulator
MGRITLAQVAAEAGVTAMTVSNVLNGRPGASETTRQRIREVAERLGYSPNLAARGLKGGRTGLVGLVTLDLTTQYGLEVLRGVADELASAELELLISATYQDGAREYDRVEFLTRGVVDGVVLVAPVLDERTRTLLVERGLPFVVVDPRRLEIDVPRVLVHNYAGMLSATQHLLELGHRRIAYLGGNAEFESSAARQRAFLDAMQAARASAVAVLTGDFTHRWGVDATTRLLADARPSAIVCAADVIAFGAIDAARAHGLEVPTDLSVVGFDDVPQAAQGFPGLTTVRQPLHDMGQRAARMLVETLEGSPRESNRLELPTELIVRRSTSPLQAQV